MHCSAHTRPRTILAAASVDPGVLYSTLSAGTKQTAGPVIDYSVSQQDEFLRRATAPSAGVPPRVVLRQLADHLATTDPGLPMTEDALRLAVHRAANPDQTGNAVARRLADTARGLAPTVRAGQTRAQYARALREVAW